LSRTVKTDDVLIGTRDVVKQAHLNASSVVKGLTKEGTRIDVARRLSSKVVKYPFFSFLEVTESKKIIITGVGKFPAARLYYVFFSRI